MGQKWSGPKVVGPKVVKTVGQKSFGPKVEFAASRVSVAEQHHTAPAMQSDVQRVSRVPSMLGPCAEIQRGHRDNPTVVREQQQSHISAAHRGTFHIAVSHPHRKPLGCPKLHQKNHPHKDHLAD